MRLHRWFLAAALSASPTIALAQEAPAPAAAQELPAYDRGTPQSARDVELEYHIESAMAEIPGVDVSNVRTRVVRGAVTVRGSVPTEAMHHALLVATSGFFGVRVVRDELSVAPPGGSNSTATATPSNAASTADSTRAAAATPTARGGGPRDGQLEAQAQDVATREASVAGPAPLALARNGVVTLYGRVATFRAAHQLMRDVQALPGVHAVRMQVRVGEVAFMPAGADRAAALR
jgi:hypothetical protein